MWGDLYDERTDLTFTIAAGPRQHSHYRVRVPSKVNVKVTLRLMVSQSVGLGVELQLRFMTRYFLLFGS
jgi:hypothetical protein